MALYAVFHFQIFFGLKIGKKKVSVGKYDLVDMFIDNQINPFNKKNKV